MRKPKVKKERKKSNIYVLDAHWNLLKSIVEPHVLLNFGTSYFLQCRRNGTVNKNWKVYYRRELEERYNKYYYKGHLLVFVKPRVTVQVKGGMITSIHINPALNNIFHVTVIDWDNISQGDTLSAEEKGQLNAIASKDLIEIY